MLISIAVCCVVIVILIWGFTYYIDWSNSLIQKIKYDQEAKNSVMVYMLPHQSLIDSKKYILFWIQYYYMMYT
jgi:hypothetical protein